MIVSLIVAVADNRAIGRNNDLIWRLPRDMRFFTKTTTGHHVIMGRKNWDSIPAKYRPLPNRTNVVISRKKDFKAEGCIVVHSIDKALDLAREAGEIESFIIGGGQIYRWVLEQKLVDKMYLTRVHESFEADTFFPTIDFSQWHLVSSEHYIKDALNPYDFTIEEYSKKT